MIRFRKAHPGIDEALRDEIDLAAEIAVRIPITTGRRLPVSRR